MYYLYISYEIYKYKSCQRLYKYWLYYKSKLKSAGRVCLLTLFVFCITVIGINIVIIDNQYNENSASHSKSLFYKEIRSIILHALEANKNFIINVDPLPVNEASSTFITSMKVLKAVENLSFHTPDTGKNKIFDKFILLLGTAISFLLPYFLLYHPLVDTVDKEIDNLLILYNKSINILLIAKKLFHETIHHDDYINISDKLTIYVSNEINEILRELQNIKYTIPLELKFIFSILQTTLICFNKCYFYGQNRYKFEKEFLICEVYMEKLLIFYNYFLYKSYDERYLKVFLYPYEDIKDIRKKFKHINSILQEEHKQMLKLINSKNMS